MGRRMTLKGQISLCLAAFFLALAGQIFLSFYQSGTVLRELDDQMGNFNATSRFQNGVQQSLNALKVTAGSMATRGSCWISCIPPVR